MNKHILTGVLSLSVATLSVARPMVPLKEGAWISDVEYRYYPQLKDKKDFVIDHRKAKGFEIYGPQGMTKWLEANHIPFAKVDLVANAKTAATYPTFAQLEANLKSLNEKYPTLTQLISVGKSINGKNLYFLKISKNASTDAHLPEFKYVSSMHGDEITGRELLPQLAADMLAAYGHDTKTTELIDNTEIYIMPSMNPDGTEMHQRFNANYADLNRDFPDFTSDPNNTTAGRQIETAAIMNFQASRNFALSANFHGGSEVVNYPWDTTDELHPFDSMLQTLSLSYAKLVPYIFNSNEFTNGITNGFAWYEVDGGMQDWSEYYYNDLQFTIELSGSKWPTYSQIPGYYQNNKAALGQFIREVHQGAGFYFQNQPTLKGSVTVQKAGNDLSKFNFRNGEFYRVLEPGTYEFVVNAQKDGDAESKEYRFSMAVKADTVAAGGNYKVLN